MVIDFHTHIFPDKIAAPAVAGLLKSVKEIGIYNVVNHTDGTLAGLKASMKEKGIDISVVQPVVTSPRQTESINSFAEAVRCENVISFGGIHPLCENVKEILVDLKEKGFKGIKLHPEYQQENINSPKSIEILKCAEELGLYTLIHCGVDIGIKPPLHCAPHMLKDALNYVSGKYIIAAHLGGMDLFDEVEEFLVGTEVFLDTAAISDFIEAEQYKRIIKNHGSSKILFASDSPWEDPLQSLDKLKSLGLEAEELENITHKNAIRILDLK